jgi:hypothetical protein
MSPVDFNVIMESALRGISLKKHKGMTRGEAIDTVAGHRGIDSEKLADYMDGKIGFGRGRKKRLRDK